VLKSQQGNQLVSLLLPSVMFFSTIGKSSASESVIAEFDVVQMVSR